MARIKDFTYRLLNRNTKPVLTVILIKFISSTDLKSGFCLKHVANYILVESSLLNTNRTKINESLRRQRLTCFHIRPNVQIKRISQWLLDGVLQWLDLQAEFGEQEKSELESLG